MRKTLVDMVRQVLDVTLKSQQMKHLEFPACDWRWSKSSDVTDLFGWELASLHDWLLGRWVVAPTHGVIIVTIVGVQVRLSRSQVCPHLVTARALVHDSLKPVAVDLEQILLAGYFIPRGVVDEFVTDQLVDSRAAGLGPIHFRLRKLPQKAEKIAPVLASLEQYLRGDTGATVTA